MLTKRISSWLLGGVAVLVLLPTAGAQECQPFVDPGYFNSDLQFFAPASDIDDFGGVFQRYGWFGAYNRLYLKVQRPRDAEAHTEFDGTYGNRWDVGYMVEGVNQDHGWLFNYSELSGPSVSDVLHQEKINRVNEDDEGLVFDDDGAVDLEDVVVPPQDRNDLGIPNRARFYRVTDSINVGEFRSTEFNKIFRMEPLYGGGLLEPLLGFRYVNFTSIYQDQEYRRYTEDGLIFPFPPLLPNRVLFDITDAETEDLITDRWSFDNEMFGGQLGFRWSRRVSRWNLSSEWRVIGLHNVQRLSRKFEVERTYYDGGGTGSEVEGMVWSRFTEATHTTETVFGADIRAEAAFEFTRDISLNVGMQYMGFYDGIGRGFSINTNQQDLNMVGLSFGVVVNR